MGKVVITEFISLDGVMDDPQWTASYGHPEIEQYKKAELHASVAMLLGRTTYEAFAGFWPTAPDEDGFAGRMNALPKFVVSSTVTEPMWNATIVDGTDPNGVVDAVNKIKADVDGEVLVHGSASLAGFLVEHGLADEIRLMTFPVTLGSGKRLFREGVSTPLELVETRTFPTGVVLLTYRPAAAS